MDELTTLIGNDTTVKLEKAAAFLKIVANPVRLSIVYLLQDDTHLSVGEICSQLDAEQSLVSHHLLNLKEKGVLDSKKEGRNVLYSLKFKHATKLIDCLLEHEL